ncbi:MAG: hypothetical protein Q4B64_05035 [Spirochaetales bacterium]|nr:hypothetical protein [Spirochaetales bacterium]
MTHTIGKSIIISVACLNLYFLFYGHVFLPPFPQVPGDVHLLFYRLGQIILGLAAIEIFEKRAPGRRFPEAPDSSEFSQNPNMTFTS